MGGKKIPPHEVYRLGAYGIQLRHIQGDAPKLLMASTMKSILPDFGELALQ